jgi:hypothetical protein
MQYLIYQDKALLHNAYDKGVMALPDEAATNLEPMHLDAL